LRLHAWAKRWAEELTAEAVVCVLSLSLADAPSAAPVPGEEATEVLATRIFSDVPLVIVTAGLVMYYRRA
jgi:hypothetical protein